MKERDKKKCSGKVFCFRRIATRYSPENGILLEISEEEVRQGHFAAWIEAYVLIWFFFRILDSRLERETTASDVISGLFGPVEQAFVISRRTRWTNPLNIEDFSIWKGSFSVRTLIANSRVLSTQFAITIVGSASPSVQVSLIVVYSYKISLNFSFKSIIRCWHRIGSTTLKIRTIISSSCRPNTVQPASAHAINSKLSQKVGKLVNGSRNSKI